MPTARSAVAGEQDVRRPAGSREQRAPGSRPSRFIQGRELARAVEPVHVLEQFGEVGEVRRLRRRDRDRREACQVRSGSVMTTISSSSRACGQGPLLPRQAVQDLAGTRQDEAAPAGRRRGVTRVWVAWLECAEATSPSCARQVARSSSTRLRSR